MSNIESEVMTMKAKLLLIGALLAIVFTTTACNETITEVERANIHMMLFEPSDDIPTSFEIDQIIQDTAKTFEKLNPQIKVIIDHMPSTNKTDDIINLLKSNDPPDIIPYGISSIDKADKEGVLMDLLTLQSAGFKEIDINKNVLDSVMFHGKLLVLPYAAIPKAVLYNKSLFDSKNIPYPQNDWTWEQFRSISQKLLPTHGSSLPYDIGFFEILLASAGKNMLSPDGSTSIGYLDSPEAVHVIQWLNAYYHDDKEKTAPLSQLDGGKQFNNLQTGMVLGILDTYTFFKTNLGDNLGVAPLPHFEGIKKAIPLYYQGYGIAQRSKQYEAAWSFLQYLTLTNQDNTKKLAQY
jgi:ABC-type glycerol-3-phosphate transport system substrate-binding protein